MCRANCGVFQLNLYCCLSCPALLMSPHSCKDCLRDRVMAGSSKDDLRVHNTSCEENGFEDVGSMPCMCSLSIIVRRVTVKSNGISCCIFISLRCHGSTNDLLL
jgi:hypothetical protein